MRLSDDAELELCDELLDSELLETDSDEAELLETDELELLELTDELLLDDTLDELLDDTLDDELELTDELELDDTLDDELLDDRSSIDRIESSDASPRWFFDPGNCKLPVWKFMVTACAISPDALVSTSDACQIVLSGSSTTTTVVAAPASLSCSAAGAASSPARW